MDWKRVQQLVEGQISYWCEVGKPEWAEALEQCLAKAERYESIREVSLDLPQRLEESERERSRS